MYVAKITGAATFGGVFARGHLKFTRPNGVPVTINGAAVRAVRAAFPGEYAPGVQSVITAGRMSQGVRESLTTGPAATMIRNQLEGETIVDAVVVEDEVVVVEVLHRGSSLRRSLLRISCHLRIDTDQLPRTSGPAVLRPRAPNPLAVGRHRVRK